ncbi:hypothetical protein APR04_000956 [Promicromonospora umidemergens]|uniref:Uncharacterized protein n=1 Tax=Promicromonospora umidemergens TaxID=629679 RepID=A0ABP8XM00_9MICO|nr:hypothetical protein [Promicromonospora umidemergens]MCP2282061.1 hypothetical protein [Promicromonospora umidemergens]
MSQQGTAQSYVETPTRTVAAVGATFAYRELGLQSGLPLVLLTHLGANLDAGARASSTGSRKITASSPSTTAASAAPPDASATRSTGWPTTSSA